MIDKRINYRFGGGYQGSSAGPVERGSSGGDRGDRGDSAREARILQQYSSPAPAPAPREERVSPIESIARIGDTSLAGKTKSEADATMESQNEVEKDTREQYISEMYTKPPVTPTEDKVPDFVKQVVTPTEEPKIDIGFQEALRKQQIATDLRQKQQDPDYGQFFRPQPVVEKPKFFDTGPGKFLKNVGLGIVAPQLLAATPLAKPYSMWRTANTVSNLAERFGFNKPKDVMQTLTSNLTTPNKTGITTLPPPREGEGKEQYKKEFTTTAPKDVITAPKDVITESVQKFSPKQLDLLQQRYAELNKVIESGEYMGQKLNNNQLATLTQTSKQMKDYLVSEVGGISLT